MDTIICGISAIEYWRAPPVVGLLASCEEDDPLLRGVVSPEELLMARQQVFESSPLGRKVIPGGYAWNAAGEHTHRIVEAAPYLAHALSLPVHILVSSSRQMHESTVIKPCLWSATIPFGSLQQIGDGLWVQRPEFALLQLMGSSSLGNSALLVAEHIGAYSPYRAPRPYLTLMDGVARRGGRGLFDGWKPVKRKDGSFADLWSRGPLCTPEGLAEIAEVAETKRGARRLKDLSSHIAPGAASPFEAKTGIMLGLPRALGGEGHEGMSFNARIDLNREARNLAKRHHCFADLFWEDAALDLECQSGLAHDNEEGYLSDADRASALMHMGVTVLPVTYGQLNDDRSFAALSATVASLRGVALRKRGPHQEELASQLRDDLFGR